MTGEVTPEPCIQLERLVLLLPVKVPVPVGVYKGTPRSTEYSCRSSSSLLTLTSSLLSLLLLVTRQRF